MILKKIVTRNISIVKEIVMSGYAYRINRVFIDKGGKRVYRFYTCPEIEKSKKMEIRSVTIDGKRSRIKLVQRKIL